MVEEHAFWARHFPGLRSRRTQREGGGTHGAVSDGERPDLVVRAQTKSDRLPITASDRLLIAGAVPRHHVPVTRISIRRSYGDSGTLVSPDGGRIGVVYSRARRIRREGRRCVP